ncbi:membrane-associated protein, putative [Bodo saltans]|uniref:Membrane-associated protein, putative n=1 Tax=Bodo saltans TaxID=75058 RepID=A0A0S4JIQ2_BODSA|nr:membrane-associated protein, putative [Bodo saltans]|eukprot:CUG90044.1 membrane-associated protein, putative [Bodo saltans]
MLPQTGFAHSDKRRCCPSIERRCVVQLFLLVLAVLPIILIALRTDSFASNNVTTSSLLGTRDDSHPHQLQQPQISSSSMNVCDQLRTALRGNSATEWSRRLLPHVYQKEGLLPSNARLVFEVPSPKSGFGLCNVRSFVLDSLILAALVGADIILQRADTLDRPHSEPIAHQLEGYFDVQHLRAEWKRFCPSMTLYHNRRSEGSRGPFLEELEGEELGGGALVTRHPTHIDVGSTRSDEDAINNNVEYRLSKMDMDIRSWLAAIKRRLWLGSWLGLGRAKRKMNASKAAYYVIMIHKPVLWDWALPVDADASLGELRRAVGASLRSPEYITRVAARVVDHLKALGEESGNGQRFCGAHLRSEPDMVKRAGKFANGTLLTDLFLDAVLWQQRGPKQCGLVYVAAGTKVDLDRFSALAFAHNITLVTLSSLNKTTTFLTETARWSHSQMAVLEYEILAASHKFFGASSSSFSWNLAIRRYFAQSTDTLPLRDIIQPFKPIPYHDNLSTIYLGTNRSSPDKGLSSQEVLSQQGMWP